MNSGEDSALPLSSSSSSASTSMTVHFLCRRIHSGRSLQKSVSSLVELVVELVGLITSEGVVYRHRAILLILRVRIGYNARRPRQHGN